MHEQSPSIFPQPSSAVLAAQVASLSLHRIQHRISEVIIAISSFVHFAAISFARGTLLTICACHLQGQLWWSPKACQHSIPNKSLRPDNHATWFWSASSHPQSSPVVEKFNKRILHLHANKTANHVSMLQSVWRVRSLLKPTCGQKLLQESAQAHFPPKELKLSTQCKCSTG